MIKEIKQHKLFIKYKKYFRFLFFCFVGGVATLIHFLSFNVLRFFANFNFSVSLVLAIFISMIFNFSANRNITFSARGHSLKKQIPKYLTVYATSSFANFLVASFIESLFNGGVLQENLALIGGLAVSIPINFFGSLYWAFKKKECEIKS